MIIHVVTAGETVISIAERYQVPAWTIIYNNELRSPDSAANPYLTLAVCLKAGLDGILNRIEPPKSVDCNIYNMTDAERKELHIESLPGTLMEAVQELKKDSFILDELGEHVSENYIAAKENEWQKYRAHVSEWEIQEYLYRY